MKKLTLLLSCFLATVVTNAQEKDYNHWSIEAGGNMSKPTDAYVSTDYNSSFTNSFGGELGVRYMINEKFGFKLGGIYNKITEKDNSLPFEATYSRATIEGVVNLGNILGFRDWTQRINLIGHAGGGVAMISLGDNSIYEDRDYTAAYILGITPQLRLSDHIALYADVSFTGHTHQDFTWDGTTDRNKDRNFDGGIATISAGLQIYLGKNEKHADWIDMTSGEDFNKLDSIQKRVAKIEDDMLDSDMDGVPNYLDREPNTMNGVTVDSKGVAVDKNNNGIPDEIEGSLDERYVMASSDDANSAGGGMIKDLINKGYVNVYFEFNSAKPETYSLQSINYLVKYMNSNSSANAELVGYADEIGNADYNMQLSEKRAKKVYDILIASGVSENRLEYRGEGSDDSVDKSSKEARQLVRRVTFKLK
ncbi:OmpA family protein [Mesonia ostreae]|uniref:OmpA family protein n=1 Tax=Mesonia ostreae TaxID=861110 RepID=A0ABU2KH38_9FLAO|nr:OmpA family protein [Mesonia ostreae]MDT0294028.1 OmpA family protein [Mesonia ostreae]